MKKTGILITTYGALVLMGGLIGCFMANSIPSLVAGVGFGSLILFNAIKVFKGNVRGLTLALMQSVILGSFFIYRLRATGKFFPAALMITLSFTVAIILLFAHPTQVPSEESKVSKKK